MKRARYLAAIVLAAASAGALAQAWSPQKNVEIVAGSAPGGSNDKTARAMERILLAGKLVPVTLTVVNKPGGGGSIAYTYVSQRPGDAHYLYIASSGLLSNHIVGASSLSHADFTPIALLYEDAAVFAVRAESPIRTGKDLVDRLKKDPRSVTVGFANAFGSSRHMAAALLMKTLGANARDLKPVVFKGSAEAITAMLGGHIDVVVAGAVNAIVHVAGGQMRVIGVAAPQRLGGPLAVAPTWKEQGVDLVYGNWRAIFAPRGLAPAQVAYWETTLRRMTASPEWKADLEKSHWTEHFVTGAPLHKEIEQEYAWLKTTLVELGLAR
ncbi:MAG TPA: tripartite tricarboxylate transporter substrate binding protein [Burkholderiales bacterium]|nr:tripartite tricarboxylate transporter substrate binding protein [Burkholderiales bacterium]